MRFSSVFFFNLSAEDKKILSIDVMKSHWQGLGWKLHACQRICRVNDVARLIYYIDAGFR